MESLKFRGVKKKALTGLVPLELQEVFRQYAFAKDWTLSEAISEALCRVTKEDPKKYGIVSRRRHHVASKVSA